LSVLSAFADWILFALCRSKKAITKDKNIAQQLQVKNQSLFF
jgi:hypothetical protein